MTQSIASQRTSIPPKHPVTPRRLPEVLAIIAAAKLAAFLSGEPGISKSQSVYYAADRLYGSDPLYQSMGWHVIRPGLVQRPDGTFAGPTDWRPWIIELRAIYLDPVDIKGMPSVDLKTKTTHFNPLGLLPTGGSGVIFIDEPNRAAPLVQNALMQLTQDRRIGEYRLPDGWIVVAAGNRESDGGGVSKMYAALSQRFAWVDVVADRTDWLAWAPENGIHPMVIGLHRWRAQYPQEGAPDLFCHFDPKARSSPNPRAWHKASDLLHAIEAQPDPPADLMMPILSGVLGESAATELVAFYRLHEELPKATDVQADPMTAAIPTSVGGKYAIAASLAASMTDATARSYILYLGRLPVEFAAFAMLDAWRREPNLLNCAPFGKWAVAHQDVFQP